MTSLEIINDLENAGKLGTLVKSGIMPCKVLHYREIYLYVDAMSKIHRVSKETIITWAMDTFKISRSTVFLALSTFK